MKLTTLIAFLLLPWTIVEGGPRINVADEAKIDEENIGNRNLAFRDSRNSAVARFAARQQRNSNGLKDSKGMGRGMGRGMGKGMGKGKGKGKGMGFKGKGSKGKGKGMGSKGKGAPISPAPTPSSSPVATNEPPSLDEDTLINGFVAGNPDLTSLTAAVIRAGLTDTLSSEALTLFAPNNSAFATVPSDILNTLLTNDEFIPHLADLLLLHVVSGEFPAAALSFSRTLFGLNGEEVFVDSPPLTVNGNNVVDADNFLFNGIVHIIDGVLIPSWVFNSIASRLVGDSDLSTFLAVVVHADLDEDAAAPGELTLVAPTNNAFDKLPAETFDFLISDDGLETLTSILMYHVFPGIFVSSELNDGLILNNLQGGSVEIFVRRIGVFFNDAEAVEVDILANNGVVHKIDTVLDPFGSMAVTDFVAGNPDLTSLSEAVVRAGLVDAFASEGPFTLFAPNNDAFAAIPTGITAQLFNDDNFIPQLQDLLFLHVIAGEFPAAAVSLSTSLFGLNGEEVFIDFPPLTVNGNNVVDGDNVVSNGIVHVIDGVLAPSWIFNSLQDRVFANDDLSTLFSLVVLTEIDLSASAALTVVGPTNAAFDLLDPADIAFLTSTAGLDDLTQILDYHVFFGILTSSILVDGFVQTLEDGLVEVSTAGPLMFNQATAVEVDILGDNGVLHKIDRVLDPADSPQ